MVLSNFVLSILVCDMQKKNILFFLVLGGKGQY